jgi:hypothetical protein
MASLIPPIVIFIHARLKHVAMWIRSSSWADTPKCSAGA